MTEALTDVYHSRENSYKEKFTLRLDLIRTSDGVTISTRNYEETGSASGKDATQYSALENSLINVPYEMGLFVENHFKVYGSILKVVSTKETRQKPFISTWDMMILSKKDYALM